MGTATLSWSDVIAIGRGMWDDVTRCRLAEREWGVALAIHPAFEGPQSIMVCGGRDDGFIESAQWGDGTDECAWQPTDGGALVTRGPLLVWRKPLHQAEAARWLRELLSLGVPSLSDTEGEAEPALRGMLVRGYFRHGSYDHDFAIGERWRDPGHQAHQRLLGLFAPHFKPSLRLYFGDAALD